MPVIPMKSESVWKRFMEFSRGRLYEVALAELLDCYEAKKADPKPQIIYTQPTESDEVKALKQQLLEADKRIQLLSKKIKKLSEE